MGAVGYRPRVGNSEKHRSKWWHDREAAASIYSSLLLVLQLPATPADIVLTIAVQ
jgi:hypothetical protein